jgi:hypothetical protein
MGRPLPGRISAFTTGLQSYGILAGGHAMRVRLVRSVFDLNHLDGCDSLCHCECHAEVRSLFGVT